MVTLINYCIHHKGVGFGVSQAARTAKSQVNIGVLFVVEVESGVCGVPPLPRGIGRVDRHKGAGLQTWKGSKAAP